jgi:mevalonate kinase
MKKIMKCLKCTTTLPQRIKFSMNGTLQIPAKCMLLGEYGVLKQGSALAALLPEFYFEFKFTIEENFEEKNFTGLTLLSSFFKTSQKISWYNLLSSERVNEFECAPFLTPFIVFWKNTWEKEGSKNFPTINIEVTKSFPTNYGFGSSSAILAAMLLLASSIKNNNFKNSYNLNLTQAAKQFLHSKKNWNKALEALHLYQQKGSGYDLAVQIFGFLNYKNEDLIENKLLVFNPESDCLVEPFFSKNELNSLKIGALWSTPVYAPTQKILQNTKENLCLEAKEYFNIFYNQWHKKINKQEFLDETIEAWLFLAKKYSLNKSKPQLEESSDLFFKITSALDKNNVIFKTTGAGCGDSLWILTEDKKVYGINWHKEGFLECPIQKIVSF